jgi:hypothetical protein
MPLTRYSATLAAGILAAFGCAGPVAYYTSLPNQVAVPRSVSGSPEELLLAAELGNMICGAARRNQLRGFARVQLRERADSAAETEVEYEVGLQNRARLRLGEGVITVSGAEAGGRGDRIAAVLWSGEVNAKPRFRVRGIVGLRPGVTFASISAALRERRGALQLRISDSKGAPLACADLRA